MTTLVLTVVGDDRQGLVAAVADVVTAHGGNWENSQLAELGGAFAGIIEVSVATGRVEELRTALTELDGLLTIATHTGDSSTDAAAPRSFAFRVLGNDHPGIVREVSSTLSAHGLSIERMTTETRDAAMSGGRLFEATIAAKVPASVGIDEVRSALEQLAAEIQVDVSLDE
ncbi:glycine cleavage system protein R [Microbacterium sp.]|uniref:glycine cleavage system protein R n=1 Tax=Microbacterium sp. TaxID=51671 RepID=UPI002E300DE6|nr:ACT domain-containing protein [Microbacterium sp.]HEX5729114.1 ACT domain-containing protein [Microbacterium sp.]